MLRKVEAKTKLLEAVPDGLVGLSIRYKGLYVFQVFSSDNDEGMYDPYYSVDVQSGEVNEFSILTDGDISEITDLFLSAKEEKEKG